MTDKNNYAYIDAANLHKGIQDYGWKLDYKRFRVWLTEKYSVKTAYLFIGLIPKNKDLYQYLQESGFTLIFKEVVYDGNGKPKGNCDAYENKCDYEIIISSDGDYASLVKFLIHKNKFGTIISQAQRENVRYC